MRLYNLTLLVGQSAALCRKWKTNTALQPTPARCSPVSNCTKENITCSVEGGTDTNIARLTLLPPSQGKPD